MNLPEVLPHGRPSIREVRPWDRSPELARLMRHTARCRDCASDAPCGRGVELAREWLAVERRHDP